MLNEMKKSRWRRLGVVSALVAALIAPQAFAEVDEPSPSGGDELIAPGYSMNGTLLDSPTIEEIEALIAEAGGVEAAPPMPEVAPLELDALAGAAGGVLPVYRFYNQKAERNYYTINVQERNGIAERWPNIWKYAGVPFGAYTTQVSGTIPVFRLYSDWLDTNVFTTDAAQRDEILKRWPTVWRSVGVSFYVYPMSATLDNIWPVAHYYSAKHEEHVYVAGVDERRGIETKFGNVWRLVGEEFKVPSGPAEAPWPQKLSQRDQWKQDAGIPRADWGYVDYIVQKESSWNPNAVNPSSGTCGLIQIHPVHTEAYKTCKDPVENLKFGNHYANYRYGGWANAYAFWTRNHWW